MKPVQASTSIGFLIRVQEYATSLKSAPFRYAWSAAPIYSIERYSPRRSSRLRGIV